MALPQTSNGNPVLPAGPTGPLSTDSSFPESIPASLLDCMASNHHCILDIP